MRLVGLLILSGLWVTKANPILDQRGNACPAESCFSSLKLLPPVSKLASTFCVDYIKSTPGVLTRTTTTTTTTTVTPLAGTTSVTATSVITVTPASPTVSTTDTIDVSITPLTPTFTTTNVVTQTASIGTVCTVSVSLTTSTAYIGEHILRRTVAASSVSIPPVLAFGCTQTRTALTSKISSACSCFLIPTGTTTTTKTLTTTVTAATPPLIYVTLTIDVTTIAPTPPANTVTISTTVTVDLPTPSTSTVTAISVTSITTQYCSSTLTSGGGMFCGVPVSTHTSGTVTCSSTVATPSSNLRHRIEGGSEGTIFEGCIVAGPREITTPSGGTHLCDGTNNNANAQPGTTITDQLDAAARMYGFSYDGSFSGAFNDYFITSIGASTQSSNVYWGVLNDEVYTSGGGCQSEVSSGQRSLWAYNAFNMAYFLKIAYSMEYQAVAPSSQVTVQVLGCNGNNGNCPSIAGASIAGQITNSNGMATFTAPSQPGCYLFKATMSGSLRSDTFYLSVF